MSSNAIALAKMPITGLVAVVVAVVAATIPGLIIGFVVGLIFRGDKSDAAWGGVMGSWYGCAAYFIATYVFSKEFLPGVLVDTGIAGFSVPLELLIYAGVGAVALAIISR
jgi:hypothetical protein